MTFLQKIDAQSAGGLQRDFGVIDLAFLQREMQGGKDAQNERGAPDQHSQALCLAVVGRGWCWGRGRGHDSETCFIENIDF